MKQFEIEDIGSVKVYKRKGSQSLRLSVQPDGGIRVTIPTWAPYASGVNFAKSRRSWIEQHRTPPRQSLRTGKAIGKAHRLLFLRSLEAKKITSRVRQTEVVISYPAILEYTDDAVQATARKASIRALKAEAEHLLPQRLADLASKHGFSYRSVSVKQLKTRWGSCDQDQNIILNLFLMQLPWHLIDYVLLHELTHTRVMRHGPPFWAAMSTVLPNVAVARMQIRDYKSVLQ